MTLGEISKALQAAEAEPDLKKRAQLLGGLDCEVLGLFFDTVRDAYPADCDPLGAYYAEFPEAA